MTVYLYGDQGVSAHLVSELVRFFENEEVAARVALACDLQKTDWINEVKLLIVPGGRSLPFYDSLGTIGNQHIIDYVKQGGCYLGLCAGAYYACRDTIFAKGLSHEIRLSGPLNFFDGAAIGPVFLADQFAYQSEQGASIVPVVTNDQQIHELYFNGGCYFKVKHPDTHTKILARYQANDLPAIIECSVGFGKVILSGVHPEQSYRTIPIDDNLHHQVLRKTLEQHESSRIQFMRDLIRFFY